MAEQAFNWRPVIERRLLVAAAVLAAWSVGIEARLIYLQVINHEDLVTRAARQHMRTITAPAKRGEIVDRRGRLLAYSVDADTIYAVPHEIADPARTAAALCGALDDCSTRDCAELAERLSGDKQFQYVKRRATPLEARKVAALQLEGVGFMKENRRFYPNRELAAHVLGYVGVDNVGLGGLEAAYDKVIRGSEGKFIVQNDARRQVFGRLERTPTTGGSLQLTIDEQLQHIAERELRRGVDEHNAEAGTAIVLAPHTGEILAMANWPPFNPNAYNASHENARRNRAVQDIYEPGSTFKLVTVSAALEERVMRPDAIIETSPGVIRFGGRVIDEFANHNYGALTLSKVIVKSSNIGAIKIGLRVGAERLGVYVNRFGFGKPTSPDFPGESPGIVWNPAKLNNSALASVSMGYQVGVTPLQVAAAMNAVASGGTWIEPRIVRGTIANGVHTKVAARVTRRAISAETVAEILPILEAVVGDREGTANKAQVPGFTVAGKTGTADKIVNGRYSQTQQNVSFVGFVPARDPAITVIVMIDSPRSGRAAGGRVAAPIFQRIAEASLRYLGVPPSIAPEPPIVVARRAAERPVLPASATRLLPPVVTSSPGGSREPLVPDLRGLSARDALRTLAKLGVGARIRGNGMVVDQTPAAGTPLERGMVCTVHLNRHLTRLSGAGGAQP